jgi:hypothetical protein
MKNDDFIKIGVIGNSTKNSHERMKSIKALIKQGINLGKLSPAPSIENI